jgi:hypothetical protein
MAYFGLLEGMLFSMLRVGVVGTGPSAFGALVALKKLNGEVSIDLFDAATGVTKNPKSDTKGISFQKDYLIDSSNESNSYRLNKNFSVPFFSKGGWSNYWGTTFLPWTQKDIELMGYDHKEFVSAYTEIAKNISIIGSKNSENEFYPTYSHLFPSAEKSRIVLQLLENHKAQVRRTTEPSFHFFESRLGVSPLSTEPSLGCVQCGFCLAGCPFGHIFNAYDEILKLDLKNLNQRFSTRIDSITSFEGKVSLHSESDSFHNYDFVFIAAGVIQSSLILSNSVPLGKSFTLETPMTLIPSFYFRRLANSSNPLNPLGITLSEMFVSHFSANGNCIGAGQIYPLNSELKSKLGSLGKWVPNFLSKRILITMYFFESNMKNHIEITTAGQVGHYTKRQKFKHRKMFQKYLVQLFRLGFISFPVNIFMRKKGNSYHFGGLFEYSSANVLSRVVENDGTLRSEYNLPRVYCVDSSSLVEPRPGPLTYSLMANAYRITKNVVGTNK